MSDLSVYEVNILIDLSYKLNTQAQKLILNCIAKLYSRNRVSKTITITVIYFSELMKIDLKNAH